GQSAAKEEVDQRRIDVHRRKDLDHFKLMSPRDLVPLGAGVVAIEAGDAVGGVRGPVDEADPGLGERALELVVLDDEQAAGDAPALPEEFVGLVFMVED